MPRLKPQTQFLLRGSALIVALLVVWWLLLLTPMARGLQIAAGAFLQIQETSTGDWTVKVPLERVLPATPGQPVAQQIHSIEFDIAHTDLVAFTFSLPVYWAIILAAPDLRRNLRVLAMGTLLMALLDLAMLFAFAQISARNAVSQLGGADGAFSKWARHLGEYLIVSVLPFITPFLIALWLHPALRAEILPGFAKPEPPPPARRAKKRR